MLKHHNIRRGNIGRKPSSGTLLKYNSEKEQQRCCLNAFVRYYVISDVGLGLSWNVEQSNILDICGYTVRNNKYLHFKIIFITAGTSRYTSGNEVNVCETLEMSIAPFASYCGKCAL